MRQALSKQLFEVTSFSTNTDIECFLPPVGCFVYYTRLEVSPSAHHPVPQICHVLQWCVIDSFLHHSLNAVINQFNVRVVGRPHIGSSEFGFLTTMQLHCLTFMMSRCIFQLKDVSVLGDASDDWQYLFQ